MDQYIIFVVTESGTSTLRGGTLVLQLHDELIYEVTERDQQAVAAIIKQEMENAMQLKVKLPVKVKLGYTWATLQDIELWHYMHLLTRVNLLWV